MNADQITGELVHIEMRRRRITQAELGEVLGISQAAAGRKLYGSRSWTLDELLATSRFLDVTVSDLMPGDDYTPAPGGRGRVNAETAPTEVETVSGSVRPKGLEPLTFWLVVQDMVDLDAEWAFWSGVEGVTA